MRGDLIGKRVGSARSKRSLSSTSPSTTLKALPQEGSLQALVTGSDGVDYVVCCGRYKEAA